MSNFQPSEKLFKKFTNKINVDKYEGPKIPQHAANRLTEATRKQDANMHRSKDKQDRATNELGELFNFSVQLKKLIQIIFLQ